MTTIRVPAAEAAARNSELNAADYQHHADVFCAGMAAQYRVLAQAHRRIAALVVEFAEQVEDYDGRDGAGCRR